MIAYFVIIVILLLSLFLVNGANILFATLIYIYLIYRSNSYSSINMMFLVGFSVYMYFPVLVNNYLFGTSFTLYYLSSLVSLYFLNNTSDLTYISYNYHSRKANKLNLKVYLLIAVSLVVAGLYTTWAAYFLPASVMYFAICMIPGRLLHNVMLAVIQFLVFAAYYTLAWGGFGRTVIFGAMITCFLYFLYVNNIKVQKVYFTLVPILGATLISGNRKELSWAIDISSVAQDSAVGPYRLASTFMEHADQFGIDVSGFLDQVVFTLLSFVPRVWWPTKPFGFGFEYVVRNMDDYLTLAGHSIAATLVGEHLYYLGSFGVVTALIMVHLVAKLCKWVSNWQFFDGYGIVLLAANMMVLVWGGMTSFSTRMLMPVISVSPIVLVYWFFMIYRSQTRIVGSGRITGRY